MENPTNGADTIDKIKILHKHNTVIKARYAQPSSVPA